MLLFAFFLTFLSIKNIGLGQFKVIGFDEFSFDDILHVFNCWNAVDEDFTVDTIEVTDNGIGDGRNKALVSNGNSITGEFNRLFNTLSIEGNNLSIATADLFEGHIFVLRNGLDDTGTGRNECTISGVRNVFLPLSNR